MRKLLIAGAGGHGKVVVDLVCALEQWTDIAFIDDRHPSLAQVFGIPVIGKIADAEKFLGSFQEAVVAIGDNFTRLKVIDRLKIIGYKLPVLIHPFAHVGRWGRLGAGTVVFAQGLVNPGAVLGTGCIVNSGAIIEHDCKLADGVHVSPGAVLCGGVSVGDFSWVGAGATVINDLNLGRNIVIGAGAVIINNLPDDVTVVGNPGRIIKIREALTNENRHLSLAAAYERTRAALCE